MEVTLIMIGAVLVLMIAESWATRRSVERIPVRILVNGTRGKSSITAYITAALRTRGLQVRGKVTGEIPALILHDGSRRTVRRRGPARIQEQFRIIRRAARSGVEALVLECMSIDPVLQQIESRTFRPQIYVLSNIRDDHREKLGRTRKEQVTAMCRAIPEGCVLVTGDRENLPAIRKEAEKKLCTLVVAGEESRDMPGSLYTGIFTENIAVASEAAKQAGMNREKALSAILDHIREGEAEARRTREEASRNRVAEGQIRFLDAFSVNDTESAALCLDRWREATGPGEKLVLVFNTRSDRPLRTDLFTDWIRERKDQLRGVFITGDHRARAYTRLKGLKPSVDVCRIPPRRIGGLPERLTQDYGVPLRVAGIGNIRGEGYRIIKEFER
jgi:poly-gamma-glutamate synthase PgsB/CapB